MDFEDIRMETTQSAAIVTIDRPGKLNAMRQKTRNELVAALASIAADKTLRVLILTGAGARAFSAGQDLDEAQSFSPAAAQRWVQEWEEVYMAVSSLPQPVVTAARGWAAGAGWQIYLLGDYRIASKDARFGMPEIDAGIPCVTGGTILNALIGFAELPRLTLLCESVDAAEAHHLGLVHEVVDGSELEGAALRAAERFAAKPRRAIALQREFLKHVLWRHLKEGASLAKEYHSRAFGSAEPSERMQSFIARRNS